MEEMDKINDEIKDREDNILKDNRKIFRRYLVFFAVIFLIFFGYFLGYKKGKNSAENVVKNIPLNQATIENALSGENNKVDFSLFWNVWNLLKEKHIDRDKLNAQEMVYGSISGMLKATGDPYTAFFNPEESQSFFQDIEGSFEGIGAELGIKDEILTVIAPLENSPAQKSGLRSGDKIIKVDDKLVADFTVDQAVKLIRGKKGTTVKLIILHDGDQKTSEIIVTRDRIELKSVELEFKERNIAYVKINKFSENTDKEFNQTVNSIISQKSQGMILDLRNNPGGLLDKSVEIASQIISRGKIIVTEEDSLGNKENIYTSGGDRLSYLPMVVLINEGSASAAEILAGALKENRNIKLVGQKTFGKGTVQELKNLSDGSSVKITIAKWLTPDGNYIMEKGILPDVEVEFTEEDYKNKKDPQLDKAVEILKENIK
jgi:carboxyl-terminal processing protease